MVVKCKYCFDEFEAQRSTAAFCSDTHRTLFGKLTEEEKAQKTEQLEFLNSIKKVIEQPQKVEEFKEKNGSEEKKPEIQGVKIAKPEFKNNAEKLAKLRDAINKIDKDFGKGSVMLMGEKIDTDMEVVPTGSYGLDLALGIGGLPRGRIVEIYGQESSGKTTLTLHVIKEAQKLGITCAFIDAEHAFDEEYAKNIGVDTDNMLISQPDYGEQALEIVDRLTTSGGVGVIVVDSVAALVPKSELEGEMGDSKMGLHARLMSQACRKLTAITSHTGTLLIFINQLRMKIGAMPHESPYITTGGRALKFYASIRLDVSKVGQIKDGDEALGSKTKVKVVKNKCAPPFKTCEFDILYGQGIDRLGEIIDFAVEKQIIKKSGSWYSYNESKLGQGKDAVEEVLKNHPDMYAEIEKQL